MKKQHTQGKPTIVWMHFAEKMGQYTSQHRRIYFTGHDPKLAGRYQVLLSSGAWAICDTDEELKRRFSLGAEEAIKKASL